MWLSLIWNLDKTSQRNVSGAIHSAGYEFCRAAALHRPASAEKFSTIHAAKFPINNNKKRNVCFKKLTTHLSVAALASVEYRCSDLRDVVSNKDSCKQSILSGQIRTPSFAINWPSLVSTARSPIILWMDSDLINLRSNTIQINVRVSSYEPDWPGWPGFRDLASPLNPL